MIEESGSIEDAQKAAVDYLIESVLKGGGSLDEVLFAYALLFVKHRENYQRKFSDALEGKISQEAKAFENKFPLLEDMMFAQLESLGHPVYRLAVYVHDVTGGESLYRIRRLIEQRFRDEPAVHVLPLSGSLLTIDVSTALESDLDKFLATVNEAFAVTKRPLLKPFINEFNNWETAIEYLLPRKPPELN